MSDLVDPVSIFSSNLARSRAGIESGINAWISDHDLSSRGIIQPFGTAECGEQVALASWQVINGWLFHSPCNHNPVCSLGLHRHCDVRIAVQSTLNTFINNRGFGGFHFQASQCHSPDLGDIRSPVFFNSNGKFDRVFFAKTCCNRHFNDVTPIQHVRFAGGTRQSSQVDGLRILSDSCHVLRRK